MSDRATDTQPTGQLPMVTEALALVGLTEDDDAYRAIVDPAGPYAEEVEVAHDASSCLLVTAWLRYGWRGRFVADTIQTTLAHLAGGTGRVPDEFNFCSLGDGLWWAGSSTAPEHADACVVGIERHSLYAVRLAVVAGGQRIKGKRGIAQIDREVTWDGSGWVDSGNGRRMRGVLDAA